MEMITISATRLERLVDHLKELANKAQTAAEECDYCYVCGRHPSSGHDENCLVLKYKEDQMELEKDYAIIETWAEALKFGLYYDDTGVNRFANEIGEAANRAEVLEVITPKEGDAVFWWNNDHTDYRGPGYCHSVGHINSCLPVNYVKANALTIGRTVGSLRELLKWAKDE